ncbi:putative transposase for insertion sequence element [Clostridium putrefaciens]|uniref:Putative transposase for insertion sequence element n=1 Tax=Clostridium putrefaciens TaxID=99675 RepID=A0A381J7N5_9CLOT|nr:IS30 family transposase [Clostridium putrefaciens]SUY47125.1 putative transposase for insertion sequence element [Clostridium putrefaciens]
MSNKELCKGKHLIIEDRLIIEYGLDQNYTLKEIAERVKKDPTTISKEIRRNRFLRVSKRKENDVQPCQHRRSCTKTNLCNNRCGKQCKKCSFINCYRTCNEYSTKKCTKINSYPYVCNGCSTVTTCMAEKSYYKAKVADSKYRDLLTSSREGLNITSEDLKKIDDIISPLISKGQSLSHILTHHKNEINCCERTLYYYFDKNAFTARSIDLPRKVKYKPRKKHKQPVTKESTDRVGRTFDDFVKFVEYNPNIPVVEMDTVHGTRSGKVLLTFLFRNCSLMLAFIIESCSQVDVKEVIDKLYALLGHEVFNKCFPVILTDNGSEFKKPEALELDAEGNQRTKIFYCNPMASYQKPHVEKNHEYIRYVIPKGISFNNRTQEDITLMINHINSTARASLNGNTPFKLAQMLLDNSLLEKLSLKHISADEVHLKPALFKK